MAAFPAVRALALVAAASLALVACGDDDDDGAAPEITASGVPSPHVGNGVLKFGTLLPETGRLAAIGPPQLAGVKLAIQDINAAGGVLGKSVEVEYEDSGDSTTDIATPAVDRLLGADVDVIVGAASETVTLTVLPRITESGVLQISPVNTSANLTDYPDRGLYFRTAPADPFQGRVVAGTASDDGADTLAILATQDDFGRGLADVAEKEFTDRGGETVLKLIYDPADTDFSGEIDEVKQKNADAIALFGFEESSKILDEMVKQDLLPLNESRKMLYLVDGNMSNEIYANRPKGELEGIKGTIPGARPSDDFQGRLRAFDPNLANYSFAVEAYDAVVVVALAAAAAKSDVGTAIADEMVDVSSGGQQCRSFAECAQLLQENRDIDYEGQSGPIAFDSNGDVSIASMGVYQYGNNNMYRALKFASGTVGVGLPTGSTTSPTTSAPSASPSATTPSSSSEAGESASPSPTAASSAAPTPTPTPTPTATP